MSASLWQLGWMSPSAVYFWFMIMALSTSYRDTPGGHRSRHARVSNPDARMTTYKVALMITAVTSTCSNNKGCTLSSTCCSIDASPSS